jgi:hypothetical protein
MPKFFLPRATNAEMAEKAYAAIRKFIEGQASGLLDARRIFRIDYRHEGKPFYAQVGEPERHEGATVIAILKQRDYPLYFVCTPDRGVASGSPILVNERDIISSIDFDPD